VSDFFLEVETRDFCRRVNDIGADEYRGVFLCRVCVFLSVDFFLCLSENIFFCV